MKIDKNKQCDLVSCRLNIISCLNDAEKVRDGKTTNLFMLLFTANTIGLFEFS